MHDHFLESVCAGLGAADSLDHLGIVLCFGGLLRVLFNRRFCCFCHREWKIVELRLKIVADRRRRKRIYHLRSKILLDFFMERIALEGSVELLQLDALRRILFVLGADVTAGSGYTCSFLLGAFHDYLNPASFLCHFIMFERLPL